MYKMADVHVSFYGKKTEPLQGFHQLFLKALQSWTLFWHVLIMANPEILKRLHFAMFPVTPVNLPHREETSSLLVSTQYLRLKSRPEVFSDSLNTHHSYDEVNEAVMEEDGD